MLRMKPSYDWIWFFLIFNFCFPRRGKINQGKINNMVCCSYFLRCLKRACMVSWLGLGSCLTSSLIDWTRCLWSDISAEQKTKSIKVWIHHKVTPAHQYKIQHIFTFSETMMRKSALRFTDTHFKSVFRERFGDCSWPCLSLQTLTVNTDESLDKNPGAVVLDWVWVFAVWVLWTSCLKS